MNKRGFLFDLDGTLVDTVNDFVHVINALRFSHQLPPLARTEIAPLVNAGAAAMAERCFNASREAPEFMQYKNHFLECYEANLGRHGALFPGLGALIDRMAANRHPWGIVTNKHRRFAVKLLAQLDISPPVLVCGDDIEHGKPAPDALLLAARQLRMPPNRFGYCGDHPRDIEAGKRAGMYTLAAGYGYLTQGEDASAWQADACAKTSLELTQIIDAFLAGA